MTISPDQLAIHVVQKLGGEWSAKGGMCRCPVHKDGTPSLSVRPGRNHILVHCFAGCDRTAIMKELRLMGVLDPDGPITPPPQPSTVFTPDHAALATKIWQKSMDLRSTPAALYLRNRSIRHRSRALRYVPSLQYGTGAERQHHPGMIARISTDECITGIQRYYLTGDGHKAAVTYPKRSLGSPNGGAVRLHALDQTGLLGLAEGTETAMSAHDFFQIPCWATLGTEFFATVHLPAGLKGIVLFLDNGKGGDRAEALFRARADVNAPIHCRRPPTGFDDWNTLAMRQPETSNLPLGVSP